jgi:hypothetical protein
MIAENGRSVNASGAEVVPPAERVKSLYLGAAYNRRSFFKGSSE